MGYKTVWQVMKQDAGDGKMKEISDYIYEGRSSFLRCRIVNLLSIFVVIVSVFTCNSFHL